MLLTEKAKALELRIMLWHVFVLLVTNLSFFFFFDYFLVFLKHFQLKHVSSFVLDQYLVVFFTFQFWKVHSYLQIIKRV